MTSKLHLITVIHALLFVLDSECKVYGGIESYDDYNNYGHVGGNQVVPVVNKIVDYYAKPQYAFGYEVDDYYNKLSHGRWEIRDGDVTQGQYRVLLPDGRIQIVSYIADKGGYRPTVTYVGKGHHPPPPPAYANVHPPPQLQFHPVPHPVPVQQDLGPIPSPTPIPVFKTVHPSQGPYGHQPPNPEVFGAPGAPFRLDLSQGGGLPLGQQYAEPGHGVGSYGDLLVYGPSSHETVKVASPGKFAKKRALIYDRDRTLYRRNVSNGKKMRVVIRGAKRSPKLVFSSTTPSSSTSLSPASPALASTTGAPLS